MEAEINDGNTTHAGCHEQEVNNRLDEPAKIQPNVEKADEPEGHNKKKLDDHEETLQYTEQLDEPERTIHTKEKPDEPEGTLQIKEMPYEHEVTLQIKENPDEHEGTLQIKEKPDELDGKQKKKRLRLLRKKKNVINGNVVQNKMTTNVKSKVAQLDNVKVAKPESVGDRQTRENIDVPEGTDHGRVTGENNGEVSKRGKDKRQKQRARKGKMSAVIKTGKQKQKLGEPKGGMNNEKMKDKLSSHDKNRRPDIAKDKLGGLIFMCSTKTKPDCFRYSVMGVTMGKKELVLQIKPGLKLFLYDFDLKLLYGVYRAKSSGGVKLEPEAFGGAFPVQVKFEVFKDCYPLPESVFKKAIKENYNEKRKFKTELTFEQVKKLTALFQTVGISSNARAQNPAPKIDEDTKGRGGFREYRTHSSRARSVRDGHTYVDYSREAKKEEHPRESFLSESEYRTYGLQGRRRSRSPPRHARLDLESEVHQRYPVSLYGDITTSVRYDPIFTGRSDSRPYSLERRRELPSPICHEPTVLDGRRYLTHEPISQLDYQTHLLPAVRQNSGLEANQQQYAYSSLDYPSDPYRSSIRRNELVAGPYYTLDERRVVYLPEADPLRRREPEVAALDYSHGYTHQEASRHDPVFAPVSSRHSFAGPSSYR